MNQCRFVSAAGRLLVERKVGSCETGRENILTAANLCVGLHALTRRGENQSHVVFSAVLEHLINQSETGGIKV